MMFDVDVSKSFVELVCGLQVVSRFASRKNEVYLVELDRIPQQKADTRFVLKRYLLSSPQREAELLAELFANGIKVPRLIAVGGDWLMLEYIEGMLLGEAVEAGADGWVTGLTIWLVSLHEYCRHSGRERCNLDTNLRNYIISSDGLFGIDFEEMGNDSPCGMIGALVAHLLTYGTAFSPMRVDDVAEFLHGCACNTSLNAGEEATEVWCQSFNQEMERIIDRRPQQAVQIRQWMAGSGRKWFAAIVKGER